MFQGVWVLLLSWGLPSLPGSDAKRQGLRVNLEGPVEGRPGFGGRGLVKAGWAVGG